MNRIVAVCAAAFLAACGGSTTSNQSNGGSGTVTGTLTSQDGNNTHFSLPTVAEADFVSYAGPSCPGGSASYPQEAALIIYLSSVSGICHAFQNGGAAPLGSSLQLLVYTGGSTAQSPIGPGTYSASLTTAPYAIFAAGPTCGTGTGYYAGTGSTVTISSVTSSTITGTFNLTMYGDTCNNCSGNAGTLTGSFSANSCSLPATSYCSAASSTSC